VIIPYVRRKHQELNLSHAFPIFDTFKGQTTDTVYHMLKDNNIYVISIPANCTNKLQPMDLSVNKVLKEAMKQQFSEGYSSTTCKNFGDEAPPPVDLCISIMKPLGEWLMNAHNCIKDDSTLVTNGFVASGITAILSLLLYSYILLHNYVSCLLYIILVLVIII